MKNEEQNLNKPQNSALNISDVSGSFKLAKQTGKLMFKFDDDEPQECAAIYDYGKVTIEIQQQKDLDNNLQQTNSSIEFTSKDGKKFRLFIENCNNE
jgi:hypothetical protein